MWNQKLTALLLFWTIEVYSSVLEGKMNISGAQLNSCSNTASYTMRLIIPENSNQAMFAKSYNGTIRFPGGYLVLNNNFTVIINGSPIPKEKTKFIAGQSEITLAEILVDNLGGEINIQINNLDGSLATPYISGEGTFSVTFQNTINSMIFTGVYNLMSSFAKCMI